MIIVHGRATSSNVQCVMWAIGELGLEYERRDVGDAAQVSAHGRASRRDASRR